ncbi:MAG: hypothetical protein M1829_006018 [Trizodia sp. TS-e1964]|nr:MAG: hypothetical protein M1829_006018 [Trizodia sp. TS-e1964]
MAVPAVKTLVDSASFNATVLPYVSQLQTLPQQLLACASWRDLLEVYTSTNPVISAFAFSLFLAPIFLVISEVNRNYSQVDRVWSILPALYFGHFAAFAHATGLPTQRIDNLLVCVLTWSVRLTYNYWRRGGYQIGSEDYRWDIIRQNIHPAAFFVLNVTFISTIQSVLLLAISFPAYVLLLASTVASEKMITADIVFSRLLLAIVFCEWYADQQQWDYQSAKALYRKTAKVPPGYRAEDLDRGFQVSGLWAWSRHPNFVFEQAMWVTIYAWSCVATETTFNWSSAGALSYLALFQGSTWLTELITARKYPEYADYQKHVGMFIPKLRFGAGQRFGEKLAETAVEKKKS